MTTSLKKLLLVSITLLLGVMSDGVMASPPPPPITTLVQALVLAGQ